MKSALYVPACISCWFTIYSLTYTGFLGPLPIEACKCLMLSYSLLTSSDVCFRIFPWNKISGQTLDSIQKLSHDSHGQSVPVGSKLFCSLRAVCQLAFILHDFSSHPQLFVVEILSLNNTPLKSVPCSPCDHPWPAFLPVPFLCLSVPNLI